MGKFWMRRKIVTDGTPPTLSLPTDVADGQTAAIITVTTNEGNGRLYWYISSSATPPNAADLKSGAGSAVAGNQAVSGTGVQTASPAGLTISSTYYAHFLQRDNAGNDSAIVSANGFTTEGLPSPITALGADGLQTAIETNYGTVYAGEDSGTFFSTTTVTTLAELQTALTACKSNYTRRYKIVCDWDGRLTGAAVGLQTTTTSNWFDNGGGVFVTNAPGKFPCIGTLVYLYGCRGMHFKGIDFDNRYSGTGNPITQYCIQLVKNSTYTGHQIIRVEDAIIGANALGGSVSDYIMGIQTSPGMENGQLVIWNCRFDGIQFGLKVSMKNLRVHGSDFKNNVGDAISLVGHTAGVSYRSAAWITQTTWRIPIDTLANKSNHMDGIQTGSASDNHIGYDLLVLDCYAHAQHSYAGDASGGGTQWGYNDDHTTADNRFCIRRVASFTISPATFRYYSPQATHVSYVEDCTFNRAGRTPSNFTGDTGTAQDFRTGVMVNDYDCPALVTPYCIVTNSICGIMQTAGGRVSFTGCYQADPRIGVASPGRPEDFHAGVDFTRGGAAANNISGKFAYDLPNEAGTQAQFAASIWANWAPLPAYAGVGAPDLTGLTWAAP